MAVVVTAGGPVGSRAAHVAIRDSNRFVRLAVVAAICVGGLLVGGRAARTAFAPGIASDVLQVGSIAALLIALGLAGTAWLVRRDDALVLLGATLAPITLALRLLLSSVLGSLELLTLAEVADAGLGLLALGVLVWTAAVASTAVRRASSTAEPGNLLFRCVTDVTALVMLAVAVTGVTVQSVGASWACRGFPDCNGLGLLPFGRDPGADLQLYHRLLAYAAVGLVVWLSLEAARSQRRVPGVGRASLVLLGSTLAQAGIGAAAVLSDVPPLTQVLHAAGAAVAWSAAVMLSVSARNAVVLESAPATRPASASLVSAYIALTKPRVMSLLLATTATAMVIAARGMPAWGTFLATLLGGALMSGGAGAINHYVDRDIDPLMGRTAWRPIPSGVISPRRALWFGIGLATVATVVFVAFVNPLAAVLAVIGLLGYVFIYTLWLKRSTPSNIVIGGAAGAIPPLVGWAAVTNEVSSLTAWYLFAIIFFWTPPHFWALSLLIRKHYERAGVPMLPVVRGEDETRRQIVLYSLLLVALTLVLSPFGLMGLTYFVAAVALGGWFLYDAVRLWRRPSPLAARRLYLYSLLYLFLLFAAMAVDRVVS
jgi:heme o synthase